MKTIAYIRVSTNKQTVENQKDEISRYATQNKMIIDEWREFEISSRKSEEQRGITQLLADLEKGDTLICSELSRLGRSTVSVLETINKMIENGIKVILIKQGLVIDEDSHDITAKVMITLFSLFSELERDLISQRTKEALASRKGTGKLGHKKGAILKSEYDKDAGRIIELRELGLSVNKIVKHLGYGSTASLSQYIKKRFERNMLGGYSIKRDLEDRYILVDGVFQKKSDIIGN